MLTRLQLTQYIYGSQLIDPYSSALVVQGEPPTLSKEH